MAMIVETSASPPNARLIDVSAGEKLVVRLSPAATTASIASASYTPQTSRPDIIADADADASYFKAVLTSGQPAGQRQAALYYYILSYL